MSRISETELQRRLRSLESRGAQGGTSYVSSEDPTGTVYTEGDTHYNSSTNNLWIFSGSDWVLTANQLHIRYADEITGVNEGGHVTAQNQVVGFSVTPFNSSGVQKRWRGIWWGPTNIASTDPVDYEWSLTAGEDGYTPILGIDYDDGISGNNIRVEYSTDDVTWVTTQVSGVAYLYIRTAQDTNNDGVYIAGISSKFVPEKGVEYDDGGTVAQLTIYKRSATQLTTPTGGEYNFGTHTLTAPTGWTSYIPMGTDPVYSSVTLANIIGNTGTDTILTWSSPEIAISDGVAGKSVYTTNVFLRQATAPGTPVTDTGSFAFGTNVLTVPTGSPSTELWLTSIPTGSDPLYASEATFSISGDTGTDSTVNWGTPRIVAQDGETGLSGLSTYLFSVFQRSVTALTTAPTGGSYNFTTNTPTAPTGWYVEVPSGTDPLYVTTTLASTTGPTGSDSTLTWSTPVILAQDGYTPIKNTDYFDGTSSYLHIKYSDDGTSFTANGGEDLGGWIGTLVDSTIADSTTFSDYTWKKIQGDSPTYERYYSTFPGLYSEIGDPTTPGSGVTWTLTTGAAPATAYWIAERYTINSVTSDWQIYPVQAKDGGLPFIRGEKAGYNKPVLGSTGWITDAVAAVAAFTGRPYTNQKEFGYGTVVVIEYDDGKLAGKYTRSAGTDTWVSPAQLLDGDLIVDGTIAADKIQANTIDATKIVVTGPNSITATTIGADPTGSASTAETNAIDAAALDAAAKVGVVTDNIYTPNTTTIDGSVITTGSVTADRIEAGAITTRELSAGAVTSDKITINDNIEFNNGSSGIIFGKTSLTDGTSGAFYGRGKDTQGNDIAGFAISSGSSSLLVDSSGNFRMVNVNLFTGAPGVPQWFETVSNNGTSQHIYNVTGGLTDLDIVIVGGGGGGQTNAAGDRPYQNGGTDGGYSQVKCYSGADATGSILATYTASGGTGAAYSVQTNLNTGPGPNGEASSLAAGGTGGPTPAYSSGSSVPGDGSRGSGGGSGGAYGSNGSTDAIANNSGDAGETLSISSIPVGTQSLKLIVGDRGIGGYANYTGITSGGNGGVGAIIITNPIGGGNEIDLAQMEVDINTLSYSDPTWNYLAGGSGNTSFGSGAGWYAVKAIPQTINSTLVTADFNDNSPGSTKPTSSIVQVLYFSGTPTVNGTPVTYPNSTVYYRSNIYWYKVR